MHLTTDVFPSSTKPLRNLPWFPLLDALFGSKFNKVFLNIYVRKPQYSKIVILYITINITMCNPHTMYVLQGMTYFISDNNNPIYISHLL